MFIRDFILGFDKEISEKWSFNTPFYYHNKKSVCFISWDPNKKIIYISFTNGYLLRHPKLLSEGRKKQKIIYIDPEKDIDVTALKKILSAAIDIFSQ